MQQDESDELPELDFGKKKLLWWAYGDIKAEHVFDRRATGEGKAPRRVKEKVFGLLSKLGEWEKIYLIMLFVRVEEKEELTPWATRTPIWRRLSTSCAKGLSGRR